MFENFGFILKTSLPRWWNIDVKWSIPLKFPACPLASPTILIFLDLYNLKLEQSIKDFKTPGILPLYSGQMNIYLSMSIKYLLTNSSKSFVVSPY